MQEVIDTDGFFVRHGRQRRAALLPVAPSPEVDVASHVIDDDERQRRRRSADRTDDNDGKVRSVVTVNSTGWANKTRGHRLVAIILSNLNRFIKKNFFTGRFLGKFADKWILKISLCLAYVANLLYLVKH